MKSKFIAAGVLAVASFSASAETYILGTLSNSTFSSLSESSAVLGAGVELNDTWNFTLAAPSSASFGALQTFAVKAGKITNFAANLVGYGALELGNLPGVQVLSWEGDLAAGNYSVVVTGKTGLAGAQYLGTVSALPVPEPETYGMLLGGLALVGAVARRRAKKAA